MSWDAPISRVTAGAINVGTGDAVVGMPAAPLGLGLSKFAGQLGQTLWLAPNELIYSSTVGSLYGGRFRYVRFRSADAQVAIGQIVFWDTTLTNWQTLYQVTTNETLSSSDNAIFVAGIVISLAAPGNYWWVQDVGMVPVKFRSVLTDTAAIGSRVYAAGNATATADVINDLGNATKGDVSLMQARYLGNAITLPVAGALSPVDLGFHNILG